MECSLAGWPSLDDFVWTGIGEINSFESLKLSNGTDNADSKSSSPASVSMECEQYLELIDTVHTSNVQKSSPVCLELNEKTPPNILQAGALVTWRWDSMNATDLASVLDSTFSCQSVSSITTEDGEYTLYGDELLMEPEKILSGDFDIFTGDSICDNSFITATASNARVLDDISTAGNDCVSRLSFQEQRTLTADGKLETVSDMKATENIMEPSALQEMRDNLLTQAKVQPSLSSVLNSKLESFEVSQISMSNNEGSEDTMKLTSNLPSVPEERRSYDVGSANHCVSNDTKSKLFASKHHCTQPDMHKQQKVLQPVTTVGKNLEHGNHLCLSTRKIEEGQVSVTSPHRKAVVPSRLSSRKRINRAQASRARCHAVSQRHAAGRARKYALRKFMQMSSTSTNRTCYKSSQNFATFIPVLHTSGHMASQSLVGLPRVQPLQRDEMAHEIPHSFAQEPVLLPVVVSAPTVTPVQAHHSNPFVGSSSSMQVDPNLTHEHQQMKPQCKVPTESLDRSSMVVLQEVEVNTIQRSPLTSLTCGDQGQCFSSESSLVHLPHAEQLNHSVAKAPGTGFQSIVSGLRAVKGNEFTSVAESLEATTLKQLENVVTQLNEQTRLSIRDSFYRLARSAKLRQFEAESCSISNINNAVETETNSLDRWIANLLFCKQLNSPKSKVFPPKSSEATCQALYRFPNANANTHHWNACVNPQEIVLCTY